MIDVVCVVGITSFPALRFHRSTGLAHELERCFVVLVLSLRTLLLEPVLALLPTILQAPSMRPLSPIVVGYGPASDSCSGF